MSGPAVIWPGHKLLGLSAYLHVFEMLLNTSSVCKEIFKTVMKKSGSDHLYWF